MNLSGMTWVGNFYQKFEAMCLEVEENMYQDTVKYVENQVQTVGATVKKFYSDVLEDLSLPQTDPVKAHTLGVSVDLSYLDVTQNLPPSTIDPVKAKASDFSVKEDADIGIYEKPRVDLKEEVITAEIEQPTPVSLSVTGVLSLNNPSLPSVDSVKRESPDLNFWKLNDSGMLKQSKIRGHFIEVEPPLSAAAGTSDPLRKDVEDKQCDSEGKICHEIASANEGFADGIVDFSSADKICMVEPARKKGMEMRLLFSGRTLEESNAAGTAMNDDMVYVTASFVDIAQSTECAEEVSSSDTDETGSSEDRNVDDGVNEPRMATVEASNGEIELLETCVMVDVGKSCFVSPIEVKRGSYKKKIRDAFSTKMKSGRKQEYEQLAICYGGQVDAGSNQQAAGTLIPTLAAEPQRRNSLARDLSESEWELV